MTSEGNHPNTVGSESVEKHIQSLRRRIEEKTRAKVRKRKWVLVLGLCVALASCFGLVRLTKQSRELDAHALTQIGRLEIQNRLPDTREMLQIHLEQEAPRLVKECFQIGVDMLPGIRDYLMKDVNARIDSLNQEFEKTLVSLMAERIRLSREVVDREYPHLGDREKLEQFARHLSEDFTQSFGEAIDALYHRYAREMRETTGYISKLNQSRFDALTKEDQIKKEIIATMVQIVRKENSRQEGNAF
jgi:hypothetical protein